MIDIDLFKINKSFGENRILKDVSFNIKQGEKVALIGENGCGKTTLLNMVAGRIEEDSGNISIRRNVKIGYLSQIPKEYDKDVLVKDILYSEMKEILLLKEKMLKYEEQLLHHPKDLDKVILKYTTLQEKFLHIGGYEIDAKVEKVVSGFKIDKALYNQSFHSLSGGEKTIVVFASIIIGNPDLLLLDEPTNHLDVEMLEWLEKYLLSYKGTMLFVSHDRYFIDKIAQKTILIDRGKSFIFYGNYSYYLKEIAKMMEIELKNYKDQEKQIKKMETSIKKLEEFGQKAKNEMFFKRARSIEKRLDRLDKLDSPTKEKKIPLHLVNSKRSGNIVLNLSSIDIKISNKIILEKAKIKISYGERVCLIGNNGCGKSTLIKYILNNKFSSNITIGYIPQEIGFENERITILEEARKYFEGEEHHLRSALCKFYFFKEDINKKLSLLSGGERVRLKLFCLMQKDFNLLILDEPTNHIDIITREILEEALKEYSGTILFVSHDRYFINSVANKIIYFDQRKLKYLMGDYEYYKKNKGKYMND